jgi:hypothetical protein
MNKWVGVQSILFGSPSLKREALIFNRIAVLGLNLALAVVADPSARKALRLRPRQEFYDLLPIIEQGIIFDVDTALSDRELVGHEEFERYQDLRRQHLERNNYALLKANDRSNANTRFALSMKHADKADEYLLRGLCVELRELCDMEAYPILPDGISCFQQSNAPKSDVVQIVLNALPVPDESTSWEHIFEYRSDPDSQAKFLDLRNWMNEVARLALTPIEIEQKLEYLISQYQRHMELHKIKTNTGTVETIIVTGAEFLEGLANFQFSNAAKALFSLKHRRIALMEGELTSLGSEVAYILKANAAFSSQEKT